VAGRPQAIRDDPEAALGPLFRYWICFSAKLLRRIPSRGVGNRTRGPLLLCQRRPGRVPKIRFGNQPRQRPGEGQPPIECQEEHWGHTRTSAAEPTARRPTSPRTRG
jgi:hypothetical protein